jgi:hypothetical protein
MHRIPVTRVNTVIDHAEARALHQTVSVTCDDERNAELIDKPYQEFHDSLGV